MRAYLTASAAMIAMICAAFPAFAGQPPIAVLDVPSVVTAGKTFTASGARSFDPDGTVTTYIWTDLATHQPVTTTEADRPFTFTANGAHRLQLEVVDSEGIRSAPALATVMVVDSEAPTAVLDAPVQAVFGRSFTLSAERSFDTGGGHIVSYEWTSYDTNQPVVTQAPTWTVAVSPGAPLAIGRHHFRLVVTDDSGNVSRPADADVIVADTDAPTAILDGPRQAAFGRSFDLSAERSFDTGGGHIARYEWTNLDTNQPVTTQDPAWTVAVSPDAPLAVGQHRFRLVVTDDSGNVSRPADIVVVVADTDAPTAVLQGPATAMAGQQVAFDASRSFDTGGGHIASYTWTRLDDNRDVNTAGPSQSFTFATPGTYQVGLVVTDDGGNRSAPAVVTVSVASALQASAPCPATGELALPVTKTGETGVFYDMGNGLSVALDSLAYSAERFAHGLTNATSGEDVPHGDQKFLLVTLKLRNDGNDPVDLSYGGLKIKVYDSTALVSEAEPSLYRASDHLDFSPQVQPGKTQDVQMYVPMSNTNPAAEMAVTTPATGFVLGFNLRDAKIKPLPELLSPDGKAFPDIVKAVAGQAYPAGAFDVGFAGLSFAESANDALPQEGRTYAVTMWDVRNVVRGDRGFGDTRVTLFDADGQAYDSIEILDEKLRAINPTFAPNDSRRIAYAVEVPKSAKIVRVRIVQGYGHAYDFRP